MELQLPQQPVLTSMAKKVKHDALRPARTWVLGAFSLRSNAN